MSNPLYDWRLRRGLSVRQAAGRLTELRGSTVTSAQVSVWERDGPISEGTRALLFSMTRGEVPMWGWGNAMAVTTRSLGRRRRKPRAGQKLRTRGKSDHQKGILRKLRQAMKKGKLVDSCHRTRYQHQPVSMPAQMRSKMADKRCRHCYGTGLAGQLCFGEKRSDLLCACTARHMSKKMDKRVPGEVLKT